MLVIYLFYLFWGLLISLFWVRRAFSSCGESGLLLAVVCGLLTEVASLVLQHGLPLNPSVIFWDQGPNPCPPQWQVAS